MDVTRRGFMQCMAWAGTGVLWTVTGGVLSSRSLAEAAPGADDRAFTFAQISDTHVGFNGPANRDATATLNEAIARINALATPPAFVLHTGDLTHGQKAGAFDTLNEALKSVRAERTFFIPGEHDVFLDGGKEYLGRYGAGTMGQGWRSFDYAGTHFVGLVNVLQYKADGLGNLGREQLEWLEKDLAPLSASTPVVVYSHVPLWAVYPAWGWTTGDAAEALGHLRRFGSVTALNGHIHQVLQKVEGNVSFHSAMSTAFPQPAPGAAPSPGPMRVADDQLRKVLGVRELRHVPGAVPLAVVNTPLG